MSEKPFWEGKTLMEIQNLDKRVKVTMENGDVFIGKLVRRSRDADGMCSLSMQLDAHRTYLHVFSAESFDTQPIIPSYVDTVELLDDPNYERIDSIEDVRVGDIFVANDGNRYPVMNVDLDSMDADGAGYAVRVNGSVPGSFWIRNSMLAYALRPKPQLPDHEGLWLDKDDALWLVVAFVKPGMTDTLLETQLIGDEYGFSPASESIAIDSPMVSLHAPFRPAKAVEA